MQSRKKLGKLPRLLLPNSPSRSNSGRSKRWKRPGKLRKSELLPREKPPELLLRKRLKESPLRKQRKSKKRESQPYKKLPGKHLLNVRSRSYKQRKRQQPSREL